MAQKKTRPDFPTMVAGRLEDGRLIGVDNSVWLYRKVPLSPVSEAKSTDRALAAAGPLLAAYEGLAQMTQVTTNRRSMSRGQYRDTHALLVNIPTKFRPPHGELEGYLGDQFPDAVVFSRLLLFGVRLDSSIGTGTWKSAVDSIAETFVSGGTPMSDYDTDYRVVDQVLRNAGLAPMTHQDRNLADAWWNHGSAPDTPTLFHSDHLHIFTSPQAANAVKDVGPDNCENWPPLAGTHALTFASVQDLDLPYVDAGTSTAQWIIPFVQDDAAAVSIRATIEPAKVTREELRRQRKQYTDDLNERASQGKMDRAEHEEKLGELGEVESVYASGSGPATLVDTSVLIAFDGQIDDIAQLNTLQVTLNTMMYRQQQAWAESMLASNVRANPYRHDLPSTTIAYSGLPSLSTVGDADGVMIGFTESDRQPALLSPTAVSQEDRTPLAVVAAASGAGKLLALDARIPTPSGWTTMGDLAVGDKVLGRDGRPATVTFLSEVNETPDLYRVTLSDGQTIDADFDHQWIVSSSASRARASGQARRTQTGHWARHASIAEELSRLACEASQELLTPEEIFPRIAHIDGLPWTDAKGIRAIFRFLELTPKYRTETRAVARRVHEMTKVDPVTVFLTRELIEANVSAWKNVDFRNRARWGATIDARIAAGTAILERLEAGDVGSDLTAAEATRLFGQHGAPMHRSYGGSLADIARKAGVAEFRTRRQVTVPMPASHTSTKKVAVYPLADAVSALAARAAYIAGEEPVLGIEERVMTTGEMLAEGTISTRGETNFAIRLSEGLQLPEADLAVDPYVLGAWLGDGSSNDGGFTGIDPEIIDEIRGAGYEVTCSATSAKAHYIKQLRGPLRSLGVLNNKHIPIEYLRGSYAQRLAVLQGLMDTDGTIGKAGGCEFCVVSERLALDTLELVRSLGIKASMTSGPAAVTLTLPDGSKLRKPAGTRYRVKFTTTVDVFRLPRKCARVKMTARKTQNQLYLTSIEKIESRPGRCIQVDSADSSYLAAGFVPTHNTMMMLWIARQLAEVHRPTVIIDPKLGSDLGDAVKNAGGQVVSLDDLMSADGIMDPLRFAMTPQDGIETAASMLLSVDPFGGRRHEFEVPLMSSLNYGVANGATCIGQALSIALNAKVAPYDMVKAVADLAGASPQFRAMVGVNPGSEALSIHDGITLIKVGRTHLNLPTPGTTNEQADLSQRISLALLRMMLFGSATALTGRDGVILQDEAWTILGSGPKEVERLGRLARSQRVLPILFSQDISGAQKAGLAGFISRGFVGPITDPVEAKAAMDLFNIEVTPERLERVTASATMDSFGRDEFAAPNWNSMKALRDPRTREVLRGSVWMYSDLSGRVIPVECTIPPEFLKLASTSAGDVDARKKEAEEEAQRQAQLASLQQFAAGGPGVPAAV